MKQATGIDNRIFQYAIIGAVLLVAALGFTFTNFSSIATLQLSSVLVAGTLGFSSFSLLGKAIKKDKDRIKEEIWYFAAPVIIFGAHGRSAN